MYLLCIALFEQLDAAAELVYIRQAELDLLKTHLGECNNNFQKLMAQNLTKQVSARNAIIGRFSLCCSC